jgi:hypothetical protein
MKKTGVFLLVATVAFSAFAATGWFQDYVLVSQNGGADGYYWIGSNPGFGTEFAGSTFNLTYGQALELGADMRYWSDTQDRTGGSFWWRINSGGFTEVIWSHAHTGGNDYQGLAPTVHNVAAGLNAGSYSVSVYAKHWGSNQGDNFLSNGGANYVATLNISKATPTITTPPTASAIFYGQTLANSSLNNGAASVPGNFAFTTPSTAPGVGTANQSATFTPTDTANYNPVVFDVSVTVNKADQTIQFAAIGNQWTTNILTLSATASSGLGVSFAVDSGPAQLNGTTLTFTGEGTVGIVASQAGDANHNAAPNVIRTFDVTEPDLAVVLSQTGVNVREAGEGRFFVRLNKDPGGTVVVTSSFSSGSASIEVAGGAELTFKPANWAEWQAVTLAQAGDENTANEEAAFAVSLAGADDVYVDATALDDDGIGENLALASDGTGVAVSGGSRGRSTNAIDGVHIVSTNYGWTVWTNEPPGTLTLDLIQTSTVSRVRLLNWDWFRRIQRYVVETSADGATWTMLADASEGDHYGWEEWVVAERQARYVRFTGLYNSTNQCVLVSELEVYGTRPLPDLIEVSKAAVNVREGGEGRFFVRLKADPAATVWADVSRSSGDDSISVQSGAAISFNSLNWSQWRPVTLVAPADGNAASETATFRVSAPGRAESVFVEAATLDDDIGENLALASGGSTIKTYKATRALQAIDGTHADSTNYAYTIWTNPASRGTLTLDLQQTSTVSRIRLLNWDWIHRTQRYVIEASEDGATWTTVADASAADRQGWDDWEVEDVEARYVRFTGLYNSTNQCVLVPELEVYGNRPLPELIEVSKAAVNVREGGEGRFFVRLRRDPNGTVGLAVSRASGDESIEIQSGSSLQFNSANWSIWQAVTLAQAADGNSDAETATFVLSMPGLAQDETVEATALDVDIGENLALASRGTTVARLRASNAAHLIDGIHADSLNYGWTTWTGDPPGAFTLDLKAVENLSRIRVLNWDWMHRVQRYTIEVSADKSTWTTVADASAADRHGWDDWSLADVEARYVRFTGLYNSQNASVLISELEVYGTPPPPPEEQGKTLAMSLESVPVSVLTSDGPEDDTGWLAVDGDPDTAWVGQKAGGGYLVIEYAPALTLKALEVDVTETSLTDIQALYSQNAEDWQPLPADLKETPVSLNFLWVIFPDDGTEAVPEVIEIRTNP